METFEEQQVIFRKGGLRGISIRDGCSKNYSGLERRDSRPFEGVDVADSCTLRIEVSGRYTRLHSAVLIAVIRMQVAGVPTMEQGREWRGR
jgi:hypothetical protein